MLPYVWKWIIRFTAGFGLLSLILLFAARFADQYACVILTDAQTLSTDNHYIVDISKHLILSETRRSGFDFSVPSPNSRSYAYLQSVKDGIGLDNLLVYSPDEDKTVKLESGVFPAYSNAGLASYLRWSPDGGRIAYLWTDQDKQMKVSVVNADGSDKQTIDIVPPDGARVGSISSLLLNAWSADSTYLSVAVRSVNNGFWLFSTKPLKQLYLDFDNQQLERGAWSSAGHTFAAVLLGDHPQLLLVTPGASPEVIRVDLPQTAYEQITWSPDSRDLALSGVARRCDDPSCALYWRYDIFSIDGTPLRSGIWGHASPLSGDSSYYLTGPGGQIAMSGHTLTANWLPQGHTWVYMQEQGTDDKPGLNWVGLDVETGKTHALVSHVVEHYADAIALSQTNQYLSVPSSFDPLPNILRSNLILIPIWQNGKMNLELSDLDGRNRRTIVTGADSFINPSPYGFGFSFWLWDKFAVILWTSNGSSPNDHMTLLDTDQSQVYEVPLDFQRVSGLSWPTLEWIAFMGQVDGLSNFYIANFHTGEWHELVHDMGTSTGWLAVPDYQNSQVAVVYTVQGAPGNSLYLMPIGEGTSQFITNDLSGYVSWSPDNTRFAFVQGTRLTNRVFTVVASDGSIRQQIPLSSKLIGQPFVTGWTKCN